MPFSIDVAENFTYVLTFFFTLNDFIDLELIFEQTPKPSVSIRVKIVIKKWMAREWKLVKNNLYNVFFPFILESCLALLQTLGTHPEPGWSDFPYGDLSKLVG